MDWLDLVIVIAVIGAAVRGAKIGLLRQAGSLAGFAIGLLSGAKLMAWVASQHMFIQPLLAPLAILVLAIAGSGVGEWLGHRLAAANHRRLTQGFDGLGGAVFGWVSVLLSTWLLAGLLSHSPILVLNNQIDRSVIVQRLNQGLPPAPPLLARAEKLFLPNGFPQVFVGPEPQIGATATVDRATVNAVLKSDGAATVKVLGRGCGEEVEGSGFVVAPGLVITNAHVVSGIRQPLVEDVSGHHYAATPVEFDPNVDLAALRVSGLNVTPLPVNWTNLSPGSPAVVLGYPNDGPLTAVGATIAQEFEAVGRNIYDRGLVTRSVYTLNTDVQPGNSGGPLVATNGQVVGVVFARSDSQANVGYALTSPQVRSDIVQAETSSAVSTGSCSPD